MVTVKKVFRWFPLYLLFLMVALTSCSKRARLQGWLAQSGGNWNVVQVDERFVVYESADSTVTTTSLHGLRGRFVWMEEDSFQLDFETPSFGVNFTAEGVGKTSGTSFTYAWKKEDNPLYVLKNYLQANRIPGGKLGIQIRSETWDVNSEMKHDLTMVALFDLKLERDD